MTESNLNNRNMTDSNPDLSKNLGKNDNNIFDLLKNPIWGRYE